MAAEPHLSWNRVALREQFQSPISPFLVGLVVLVIFLTIFAWAWAVRRPAPVQGQNNPSSMQATPTETPPLVYAAIGASDVLGVGASDHSTQSWVNVLHARMPSGTRFVRLGRGGITLREAMRIEVPQAVAARPDIITLWNCVNDATQGVGLTDYLADLNKTLTRLTTETGASIVLLNMPDISILAVGADPTHRALVQGGVLQWNKGIADTASAYGDRVKIVDLFPISNEVLDHPEYLSSDDFHPSTAGYRRLAEVVWATIERDRLIAR